MLVEVWADVACPWCLKGKRRLEAALEQFEHRDAVEVRWRSFELHPDAPPATNTFDAHRLLHLAAAHGRQHELKERLMRGYLGEGELMSDHAALTRLAVEAGLPEDEVRDTLATDRFAAEVREDEATARGLGISAVPFFVIDRRFGLAGAQPPEILGEGLRRAWEARAPLTVVADGDACGVDGC